MRHGQTDWNKDNRYQGQHDIPLNAEGRRQAQDAVERYGDYFKKIDCIFYSPLLRAKETADIIRTAWTDDIAMIPVPELMECNSVSAAKFLLSAKGITDNLPSFDALTDTREDEHAFLRRVTKGLQIVQEHDSKTPLIAAHGGVNTALSIILKTEIPKVQNCTLTIFEHNNGQYKQTVI